MKLTLPLNFEAVDGLAFAAAAGCLSCDQTHHYVPSTLGPLLELFYLTLNGRLPADAAGRWLAENGTRPMITALHNREECWIKPHDRCAGFIRAARRDQNDDALFTKFLMNAQRAAREIAQLSGTTPGQLVAAMRELESNIHEHSEASETGILAFRAAPRMFEFVAADSGIGILKSLQACGSFADLPDHGRAIQTALSDGASRFGTDSRRGHGFRPIFLGLSNLQGFLRFRSGDHALLIDGTSPNLAIAQLAQKPMIDGFFASVRCELATSGAHVGSTTP